MRRQDQLLLAFQLTRSLVPVWRSDPRISSMQVSATRTVGLVRAFDDSHLVAADSSCSVRAGATFAGDEQKQMTGSFFLMREVSLDAARARLARDVYATGGAWDLSKVRSLLDMGRDKHDSG